MRELYLHAVAQWPLATAMLQFAILGTLGDVLSGWVTERRQHLPFGLAITLLKMAKWAMLAVPIKLAFVGHAGFVEALAEAGYLPDDNRLMTAFATSLAINLQFGPLLVISHRWLNNCITDHTGWAGIDRALWSLAWFWLPAHTVTFLLPAEFRIGLAALWSLALGMILGLSIRSAGSAARSARA